MKDDSALGRIPETFKHQFGPYVLPLPRKAQATRSPGFIAKKGWLVQYLFGKDERGEYMDFYSSHRMCV
ncbi:MAG TPA: hypothetical protein PLB02_06645, partial [Thermoanaerobaculia bacterium]|nr:hypothetical protein [Thermoanaerobaculia bacterium]